MLHVMSRDLQIFQNTNTQKCTEKFWRLHRKMVFKDCKDQEILSFLFRFQGGYTRL